MLSPAGIEILFEDDYILVLDKPGSLMVEPDRNNYPNLLQSARKYLQLKTNCKLDEVYVQHIHRLDRPVSGVILFAKQKSVLKNLSEQFAERKVRKYYKALTDKSPQSTHGIFEHWHRKEKKMAVIYKNQIEYSEKVRLDYAVSNHDAYFLWDIELHTGKFHQIRAQLAFEGFPVIGDQKYGSAISYKSDMIALNASRLVFKHPITNEEMCIDSRFSVLM